MFASRTLLGLALKISFLVVTPLFTSIQAIDYGNYEVKPNKSHLIIGSNELRPYIMFQRDKYGKIIPGLADGLCHQILLWMGQKHDFSFHYVEPPDGAYGGFVNGSWNGLVGMAIRREIDVVATSLTVTYKRSLVIDFTFAFMNDPINLVTSYPEATNKLSGIVRPFRYELWIANMCVIVGITVALWKLSEFRYKWVDRSVDPEAEEIGLFRCGVFVFGVTVSQAQQCPDYKLSSRIVAALWCLTSVILVNSYTTTLVSYMTSTKLVPVIDSIEDLAAKPDYQFMVETSTSFESTMLSAANGSTFAKIGQSLREHPENAVKTYDNLANLVSYHRKVWTQEQSALEVLLENDLKEEKKCRLYIAKTPYDNSRAAFALHKGNPLTQKFNMEITLLHDLGLIDYWKRRYWPLPNRCTDPGSFITRGNKRLSLEYLAGAFLLYLVGITVVTIAFIAELFYHKHYN